jgi:hypothetical protein
VFTKIKEHWLWFLIFVKQLTVFCGILLFIATRPFHTTTLGGDLPIIAPTIVNVGEPINVMVGPVYVTDGTQIGLVMLSTDGLRIYNSQFVEGVARFVIPQEHTTQAGRRSLVAIAENARGEVSIVLRPIPESRNVDWQFVPSWFPPV